VTFPPGARLGPYEIRGANPVTGLGEVYDARDHERGRDVSLRVVPAAFAHDPQRRLRFEREAGAAARVEHPHILTVHDVGADARAAYIVSEPINGRTLREVLDSGPIPAGAGIPFVPQIEDALRAAHDKGVVHGDLTPDAILFTTAGVKVIGFGLSAVSGRGDTSTNADLAALRELSSLLGAPVIHTRRAERRWPAVAVAGGVVGLGGLIGLWLLGNTPPERVTATSPLPVSPPPPPTSPQVEAAPTASAAVPSVRVRPAPAVRRAREEPDSPAPAPWTPSRLAWVTGDGTELQTLADGEDFGHLALSPDGMRVAVSIRERDRAGADIWIIDVTDGTRTRLTADSADDIAPLWSHDGRRVAFASWRNRAYDLYERASDGTGAESVIVSAPGEQIASDWTRARGFILYQTNQPGAVTGANPDLWARSWPLGGRPFAFLRTVHAASRPSASPDARWVAFALTGSGGDEVYVARFPHYNGRRRISTDGGSSPRWRGGAIFYVDSHSRLVSVPMTLNGSAAAPGVATTYSALLLKPERGYAFDVAANGRVLVNAIPARPSSASD
jgi:hypothetical protein